MPRFVFDDACLARIRCLTWPGWKSWRLTHPSPVLDWLAFANHPPHAALRAWLFDHACAPLLDALLRDEIGAVFPEDPDWPPVWNHIPDPPALCFIRGTWDVTRLQTALAFVGTRKPTSYGRTCVEQLIRGLAPYPVSVISGLALGIDGAAHELALTHALPGIAVLGSGLDDAHISPSSHYQLGKRLVDAGGCLLSEYLPGTPGFASHFPQRNRLIASLATSVVVIEATQDSGSLITAKLALDYGREVFAVPGPIWSEASRGCHELIKQGANVCASSEDLLAPFVFDRSARLREAQRPLPLSLRDPLSQNLVETLTTPHTLDELCLLYPLPIPHLLARLSALELDRILTNTGDTWHKNS